MNFNLSEGASVAELRVYRVASGTLVANRRFLNVGAGTNALCWDGKNDRGEYVDIGDYQIGVVAQDPAGNQSLIRYCYVRVDY